MMEGFALETGIDWGLAPPVVVISPAHQRTELLISPNVEDEWR